MHAHTQVLHMLMHELAILMSYTSSINELVWRGIKCVQCSTYRKRSLLAKTFLVSDFCFFHFALLPLYQCRKQVMPVYCVQLKPHPVIL